MSRPRRTANALPFLIPAVFIVSLSFAAHSSLSQPNAAESGRIAQIQAIGGATATPGPGQLDPGYSGDGKATFGIGQNFLVESHFVNPNGSSRVGYENLSLSQNGVIRVNPNGVPSAATPSPCTTGCSTGNQTCHTDDCPNNTAYAAGMFGFEGAIFTDNGNGFNPQVFDLGAGQGAFPGIGALGDSRFVVTGHQNNDIVIAEIDIMGSPPYPFTTIDISTNDFGFDVGLPPGAGPGPTDAYTVARGGSFMVLSKTSFPGANLVTDFGTGGSVMTNFGGTFAEGHEVAVLETGEVAVAGTRDNRFFIALFDGETGNLIPEFGTGGVWTESLGGSTESQGWSVVALSHGLAALGWAEIGGVRQLIIPVFDGYEPDDRYPNNGIIIYPLINNDGFPISLQLVDLSPDNLGASPPTLRWSAAGTEASFSQGFVVRFGALEPTTVFFNSFETGNTCSWSNGGGACTNLAPRPPAETTATVHYSAAESP